MKRLIIFVFVFGFVILHGVYPAYPDGGHLLRARKLAEESAAKWQEAYDEYLLAIRAKEEDERAVRLEIARLLIDRGRYEDAAENLLFLWNAGIRSAEITLQLAKTYLELGHNADALEVFRNYAEEDNDELKYLHGLACERLSLFDRACELYAQIHNDPFREKAQARMAAIHAFHKEMRIEDIDDKSLRDAFRASPSQEAFPEAAILVILDETHCALLGRNKAVIETRMIQKILSERGKSEAEVRLEYDNTFETLEILSASTIKPDGTVVPVGLKHIRDVSKYSDFPLYSNARIRIISMPEIEKGALIEYRARWTVNRLIADYHISHRFFLQGRHPVISMKWTVAVPKDLKLNITSHDPGFFPIKKKSLKPDISTRAGQKIYRWEYTDIPQIIEEPSMPPVSEISACVGFSTFSSWQEIYEWWRDLIRLRMVSDQAIEDTVRMCMEGAETDEDKARALSGWVKQNIRYVAVGYGTAGHQPHYASDIFKNRYGDCKDQTILLVTMLREAGVEAYPALIGTRGLFPLDKSFPELLFNHCITAIELDDKLVFVDTTAQTTSFDTLPPSVQDRLTMVFYEDRWQLCHTPGFRAEDNAVERTMELIIQHDGAVKARRKIVTRGYIDANQRYWVMYSAPYEIKKTLQQRVISLLPTGELETYHLSDPLMLDEPMRVEFSFRGAHFLSYAGAYKIVPAMGELSGESVAVTSRQYPMLMDGPKIDSTKVSIEIPEGYTVVSLPGEIKEKNKWMQYSRIYKEKKNGLVCEEEIRYINTMVKPDEYRAFKEWIENIVIRAKEQILMKITK